MSLAGRQSFTAHLWASFRRIRGWVLAAIGCAISLGTWFGLPDESIPARWVALSAALGFLLLAVLADLASEGVAYLNRRIPKARYGASAPPLYRNAIALIVLDPSDLFGHESVVSIYRQNGPNEQLLGIGVVATIQENGRIQVVVTRAYEDTEFWDRLTTNEPAAVESILVKPSIPRLALEASGRELLPRGEVPNE